MARVSTPTVREKQLIELLEWAIELMEFDATDEECASFIAKATKVVKPFRRQLDAWQDRNY